MAEETETTQVFRAASPFLLSFQTVLFDPKTTVLHGVF
jgi:hypothetical protein